MAVFDVTITRREPYADDREFGDSGVFERIDATVEYAVDPAHIRNLDITDLGLAPREPDGLVHFIGDLSLIQPIDPVRGGRKLFVELPNRGRRLVPKNIHRATGDPNADGGVPAGDGLLFRHGFSVASVGWQWDVFRGPGVLGVEAPIATDVSGPTMIRFQPSSLQRSKVLTDRAHRPLPAADIEQPDAQLIEREWELGPGRTIPRDEWRFAREDDGQVIPDANSVYYEPGFVAGKIYEVIYVTDQAPVGGVGLIAIRDLASFLKYDTRDLNPGSGRYDRVYGFGISQTGRILRRFVCLGLNLDESNRKVYDGLNPHVAGARQGDYNVRFGQPGNAVQATPNFGSYFPFTDEPSVDSMTGKREGLLDRVRENGSTPKIFWTNTSAELWRGDGYLLNIDPEGKRDLPGSPESRIYFFAGTQHGAGSLPLGNVDPNNGIMGQYPFNVVDHTPLMRAAILNLDAWVRDGIEPPASYHPRVADGSAISYTAAIERYPQFAGLKRTPVDHFRRMPRVHPGPNADRGIHDIPPRLGDAFEPLVWDLDEDGNERSPVRLPDLSVPVGTHTGWNPRHSDQGSTDQLMPMRGFSSFFPATPEAASESGDRRRPISERYASREEYLGRVRIAAEELAMNRHILTDDVEIVVENAAARYDAATEAGD